MKVFALLMLVSAGAFADDSAMRACRGLGDATVRLACYDAIALDGTGAPAATPAPARLSPEQAFGLAPAALARPAEAAVDSVETTILGYFDGWGPNARIKLANGQTWRVVDGSEAVLVPRRDPKVKISRNFLGTMFMQIEGTNNSPKVRRVD